MESTKKCGSSVPMNHLRKPGRSCCVLQWSMTALKGSTGSFGCRDAGIIGDSAKERCSHYVFMKSNEADFKSS